MVGSSSSKILTVSYGTFSCTLEGFDDPFSTMRHIAEYFRDLAADDRYFGAEPPTPDAEMLHRIAEREIQRRVETRVTGESVVLRQLDTGLQEDEGDAPAAEVIEDREPEPTPHTDAAEPAPATVETATETEPEVSDAATAEEVEPQEPETVSVDGDTETSDDLDDDISADDRAGSIEEKLSRIRAVVERTRSRDLGAGLAAATSEESDADDEAMVADMSPGFAGDIDASLISQVMAEQAADDTVIASEASPDTSEEPTWDFGISDGAEEATVPSGEAESVEADDASDEDVTDGEDPLEQADTPGVTDMPVEDEEATDAAIARIMAGGAPDTDDHAIPQMSGDEPEVEAEAAPEIMLDTTDGDDDTARADTEEMVTEDDAAEDEAPEVSASDDSDEPQNEEGDLRDANVAEDKTEDTVSDADDETRTVAGPDDEEHSEDGRALDLEAEGTADWHADAEAEAAPEDADTLAEVRAERSLSKSSQLRTPEEESERLESQTESAFAENEGSRRRSAIAHLKAAVAATRADKILSKVVGRDRASDPEEQKEYREDLSKVVKSRPTSLSMDPESQAEEPEVADETPVLDIESISEALEPEVTADADAEIDLNFDVEEESVEDIDDRSSSRVKTRLLGPEDTVEPTAYGYEQEEEADVASDEPPSPLMLVSELRVEPESAIQPRRVSRELSAEETAEVDKDKGFAEFAERMGATDLPDLMEAAAAYTAYVEDQPHFSRPQIMRRVAKIDPSIEDSREAGLRSFGQLLRQGRIVKLTRGQFTVADTTRFKPEQRIAGE